MKSIKIIAVLLTFATASVITLTAFTANQQNVNDQNIVELASETEILTTLVAAVQAAGLVETLQGDGPFTVFAPTNEAFAALPEGTVESLLMEENRDQLIKILTYHVVSGKVMSGDLSDGMMAETVEGSQIEVSISGYGVNINNASVVQADIEASNGVVHLIDTVIMPE
jgi:uncharacterized surface protein with fasciclin (FAS1) repeats